MRFYNPRGFTLVELLVVSGIILFITSFIIFRQNQFNSSTVMRSLTYGIALSVRQAQTYGTSVRESTPGSGTFAQGYGVHFPSTGANADTYYQFTDSVTSNGFYDSGEALPSLLLGKPFRIMDLCTVAVNTGTLSCTPTTLTIFFRRPNPDACISANAVNSCAIGATAAYSRAYIVLGNTNNSDTRAIKVTDTGQIAVCAPNVSPVSDC